MSDVPFPLEKKLFLLPVFLPSFHLYITTNYGFVTFVKSNSLLVLTQASKHKSLSEGSARLMSVSPIFKFSATVRKVIYTTNAIESLNSTYRKLNRQRSVFPSDTALLKALYLATFEATKKWTTTIRNWAQVYGELSIMYEGRLPE